MHRSRALRRRRGGSAGLGELRTHAELFPELADTPVHPVGDAVEAYHAVVAGRLLVTRPTCNNWFSTGLGERLRSAARRHIDARLTSALRTARRRWPLLSIEVRCHDRRWVNQEEALPKLIDNLAERYPQLGIVIAGWSRKLETDPLDEKMVALDTALAASVREQTTADVPIFDITGVSALEKMAWADACDAFVASYGTGIILPAYMARCPGVMHTNSVYASLFTQRAGNDDQAVVTLNSLGERPVDFRLLVPEDMVEHAVSIRLIDPGTSSTRTQTGPTASEVITWRGSLSTTICSRSCGICPSGAGRSGRQRPVQ